MNIINLTPHDLNIFDESGNETIIKVSGMVARIETQSEFLFSINGIPFFETVVSGNPYMTDNNGEILDVEFPEQKPSTIYIVSGLFRQHFNRSDCWQPGQMIRDDNGKPIGALGLSQ